MQKHQRTHSFAYKSPNGIIVTKSFECAIGAPTYDHSIDRSRKNSNERNTASLARSIRSVKRLAIANYTKNTKMWTLTFGVDRDRFLSLKESKIVFESFLDRLRYYYPDVKYLATFERHKSGHYHIHMAIFDTFIKKSDLQNIWGLGIVQFSSRDTSDFHKNPTKLGYYLSKYISKTFLDSKEMLEIKVYYRSRNLFSLLPCTMVDTTFYDCVDTYRGSSEVFGAFEISTYIYNPQKEIDYFISLEYSMPILV